MIYYPLDTLAGMGIREVMVIVGGKSVGDIVELLGDGRHFGLDLTYRYQRGALGIAHAIGLARDFIGDDAFCVVLGDNILRGAAARGRRRAASSTAPWGAGTLLYRVAGPGAVRRRGAGRGRQRRSGSRRSRQQPESRPDPDRRLLPAPGRVRRHRALAPSGPRRVRDHRRAQPLHPGGRPVRPGLRRALGRRRHGAEPAARRRARRGATTTPAACPPPRRATPVTAATARRPHRPDAPPPGHRRRRVHRLRARPPDPRPARRHARHGPRQAHLRRQPRQPRGRSRRTPSRPRGSRSSRATSPTRRSSAPLVAGADAVVNVAAETHVDRSILDPEAFLRTGVIGVHVLLEAVRARAGRGPARTRGSSRSAPTRSTATSPTAEPRDRRRSPRAARMPRRRPSASSWSAPTT